MAKKPKAAAKADGEAIPDKPTHRTLKDGRVIPIFETGPDGGPSEEEQAWADEEQRGIMARVKAEREAAEKAERENYEAKLKKAEERKAAAKKAEDDRWAKIEARLDALEKAKG